MPRGKKYGMSVTLVGGVGVNVACSVLGEHLMRASSWGRGPLMGDVVEDTGYYLPGSRRTFVFSPEEFGITLRGF